MTKILTPILTENKRQIRSNDKSAILTFAAAIVLLGAFFTINPINLTVFADVDPDMVDNSTGANGPVHPGDLLVVKNVTLTTGITPAVNVTFTIFNSTTEDDCVDLLGQVVLNLTTSNMTTNIPTPNDGFLLYNETFVGMPGVYHCDVEFIAANVTTSSDTESLGTQTVWIDAIGSHGYWKNHPDATEQHLDGLFLGDYEVLDTENATAIFKAHKGKFDLDKLAGQLLAAKLNIWALNMTAPFDKVECIASNVTAADEYLVIAGYDGVDTAEIKKKDKSAKAEALGYHSALDDFNNFGCP